MTNCTQCAARYDGVSRFCGRCGARVSRTPTLASWWRRVFAGGIDLALFGFAGLVMGIAGAIIYFEGGFVVGAAVVWFAWVVYSIGAFGAGGGIGMQLTGLRVVNVRTGREPGPVRAAIRLAVSVPSLWLLGIGYLWMIGDRNKQAWHDKAAGTVVVRDVVVFGEPQAAPP